MTQISVIILAAGNGTRMQSNLPKVLHKIAGRSMLENVIANANKLQPTEINIVISEEFDDKLQKNIQNKYQNIIFTLQKERLGTGHAVKTAISNSKITSNIVLVLYGDTPFVATKTMEKIIANCQENTACVLGFEAKNPGSYGRLVTNNSSLEKIVEFKDANEQEKEINLCNSGVMAILGNKINNLLAKIDNNNASNEFYLTDIIAIAKNQNLNCSFIKCEEDEVLGVNSKIELAKAEKIMQDQIREKMLANGVTMTDPNSVYFSYDTKISNDVIIHPNVVFGCHVEISSGVEIKSFSHIEGAKIAKNSIIGPFARLRPGANLHENVKIGNFVEIKKANIAKNSKINHLSYIGDAKIGENSNIGAGTITCNYDGYNKFITNIGSDVFIGSNSALIAPVNIADNSMIGAGSVISKDVAKGDLAISRSKQISIKDGSTKFRKNKNNTNYH